MSNSGKQRARSFSSLFTQPCLALANVMVAGNVSSWNCFVFSCFCFIDCFDCTISELALRLFCSAALHAGRLGFEPVAYEFIARAFNLYEEIAKADAQFQSITLIIATLQNATFFTTENYDTLVSKSAQVSLFFFFFLLFRSL